MIHLLTPIVEKYTQDKNSVHQIVSANNSLFKDFAGELSKSMEQIAVWHPDKTIVFNLNINIKDSFNPTINQDSNNHIAITQDSNNTTSISNDIDITKDSFNTHIVRDSFNKDERSYSFNSQQTIDSYNRDERQTHLSVDSHNTDKRELNYSNLQFFKDSFNSNPGILSSLKSKENSLPSFKPNLGYTMPDRPKSDLYGEKVKQIMDNFNRQKRFMDNYHEIDYRK